MEWFKQSKFRNLVDMHINKYDDTMLADFDADAYAKNMKTAGFDTAYIYGSNCLGLCLFPTNTGYRHPIAEKRDIFGETVEACRKYGVRPVGYLNNWCSEVSDRHPDWRVVGKDGSCHRDFPGHDARYGVCCFNSPYRDFFLSLVSEFCSKYEIEGLWIDMVGFWREACYCDSCREKFRKETGYEIPETVDWESPVWKRYVEFRQESMRSYAAAITQAAKSARPGITVSIQSAGWRFANHHGFKIEYFGEFDYAAGDFYTDVRDQAVDSKFLRSVTNKQPFEYMVPRCPNLSSHTVSKPLWELRRQAFASVLHGGAFLCIDAIDPAGTLNSEIYNNFHKVLDAAEPFFNHPVSEIGEYIADVAVYMNYESAVDMSTNGMDASKVKDPLPPLVERMRIMNRSLSMRHIQYDIITKLQLDKLSKYSLIILSDLYTITPEEAKAFTEYVKGGGKLYISGRTGLVNESPENGADTLRRDDFMLADVMGVNKVGELPYDSCYIKGVKESELFSKNMLDYPLGITTRGPEVSALHGTEVLATATLPLSNHDDGRKFLSAISDPPYQNTDIPVLTQNSYGKGKCIYCPLITEADEREVVRNFWLDIIEMILGADRKVTIKAPVCVEASVKKTDESVHISLLNIYAHETGSSAGDTYIILPGRYKEAKVFPEGTLEFTPQKNETKIKASELPEFAVITVK